MKILEFPENVLFEPCHNYDIKLHENDVMIADKMVEIMFKDEQNYPLKCQGFSAPQVGVNRRFFVMRFEGAVLWCFDPKIDHHGRQLVIAREGCMSVPGTFVPVPRWRVINVAYMDKNLRRVERTLTGFDARVYQHECDHLDGKLIV